MRKSIRSSRRGFTLLEVLVATAVTLLMMISLAQVFKIVGDSMKQGRAALQMNNTLRSVSFRLRHDLNNLTVRVDPPADSGAGAGYFEYFDGSMTDYTCTLFDPANTADPTLQTSMIRSSRYGDVDDILMFTARAGDSWFVGQVPAFVLNPAMLTVSPPPDSDGDGILDKYEAVMISSQLAEIVVFARPVNSYPSLGVPSSNLYFDDADGNHLPDAYQLHYRALLIRPDLNMSSGTLPADGMYLTAGSGGVVRPTDMAPVHQQCDLSVRRVPDGGAGSDFIAANSLEDLMDPANRFAHFEYRVPGSPNSTTMPLLVLQPIPQTPNTAYQGSAITVFADDGNPATASPLVSDPDPASVPTGLVGAAGNFLHQAFVLGGDRRGEDILANDLLAFDVKGYDGAAPVIGTYGVDGVAGAGGSGVLGQDGSDDVILSPNDPGYGPALAALAGGASTVEAVSYGSYVDLMWGRKTMASLSYYGLTGMPGSPNMFTELSGLSPGYGYGPGLIRSGKAIFDTSNTTIPFALQTPVVLQPTFDTWTTRYENDGALQAERDGTIRGVIHFDHFKRMHNSASTGSDVSQIRSPDEAFRVSATDAGVDGIDNNSTGGADDPTEMETQAPFPVQLRGIKVSVRIEDRPTRQIRQMSVANEFVTQ